MYGKLKYLVVHFQDKVLSIAEDDKREYVLNLNPEIIKEDHKEKTSEYLDLIYNQHFSDNVDYKRVCFIHSCTLYDSKILESVVDHVMKSELGEILDAIWVINIGLKIDPNFSNPKIKIIHFSDYLGLFEIQTINLISKFSRGHPNVKLLYLHNKGVTYPETCQTIIDWRNYMLYFLVDIMSNSTLRLLDGLYDTIGVNYTTNYTPHYSGNFWWANTNYLAKLPSITKFERFEAEWWVLSSNIVKAYNSHTSNVHHSVSEYPQSLYNMITNETNLTEDEIRYIHS